VAESAEPVRVAGGMVVVPKYTIQTASPPKLIVIPAQRGESPALIDWIQRSSGSSDVTMSICAGSYLLAKTGLLNGRSATTHHKEYERMAEEFPAVRIVRGARFVDDGNISSSGGLSSGIDLALHVVERYFGRDVASNTADILEYQGQGWLDQNSNRRYATAP
jgi:transcriptional regulator GlxA family with amidase domain